MRLKLFGRKFVNSSTVRQYLDFINANIADSCKDDGRANYRRKRETEERAERIRESKCNKHHRKIAKEDENT